ncbi:hypothetical protein BH09BAC3_BH09BAC3_21930 [soil metagenome]
MSDLNAKIFFNKRNSFFLLILISCLATALRLYHLDYQSLAIDEIASMNGTDPELSIRAVVNYSKADQPPAFFILLHFWLKIFPFTDWSGRLLAMCLGVIGVVTIFFFGKEVKNNELGVMASLIACFSYIHIYFSQDARFYTLVFLLTTLSWLFYIRAVKSMKIYDFLLYTIFTSLVIYSHYFGLVVFASQGFLFVLLLIFYPSQQRFIILGISSALLVIICIVPWLPVFFADSQIETFWIQPEPFYFPIKYFYVYFKDVISCLIFGSLLLYYFFDQLKTIRSQKKLDRIDFILITGAASGILFPLIYSIIRTPLLNVRYTIIILPSLTILICLGFSLLKKRLRWILLTLSCFTTFLSLIFIEDYYTKPLKEDWRGLVEVVIEQHNKSDLLVSRYSWYCNYYFKSRGSELRVILPAQFVNELSEFKAVWWLDGFDVPKVDPLGESILMQKGYRLEKTDSLFRTRANYYQRTNSN